MRHPYSGLLYELGDGDGEVVVSDELRRGVYDTRGRHVAGDRLPVCPHMCIWVGEGPRETPPLSANRRFMTVVPKDPA